jgi:protocatechuate 3,4-dioxygenase beta subunit
VEVALFLLLLAASATGASFTDGSPAMNDEPGQPPAAPPPQIAAKRGADPQTASGRMLVVGRVVDTVGKPVPSATLMVYARLKQPRSAGDSRSIRGAVPICHAVADGSGRFRIDAPRTSSSRYQELGATALAPGYGIGWVRLDPDEDQPAAEITLEPEQVIPGRVFDAHGRPVRDLKLSVWFIRRILYRDRDVGPAQAEGPSLSHGQINDFPGWPRPAVTDAEGRFHLRGLGRGLAVSLRIDDARFPVQMIWPQPDVLVGSKPLLITLASAQIITGRVTYADTGAPVPHCWLTVDSYGREPVRPTDLRVDGEGHFRVNPAPGERFDVMAHPPDGQPYLSVSKRLDWPHGAVEQSIDLVLPRGVLIRGKVTEAGTSAPVAGAALRYAVPWRQRADPSRSDNLATTSADGSFAIAVPPEPGQLIIQGPSDDYVLVSSSAVPAFEHVLLSGRRRLYAHALIANAPKPGSDELDVRAALRRGTTVSGRVIRPDGKAVQDAWIIGPTIRRAMPPIGLWWFGGVHGVAHNGRFVLYGLDPGATVPVHFFEPHGKLGATALLAGKSPAGQDVVIRLEPCGMAVARLVDPGGKPVAGFRAGRLIAMAVTPGASSRVPGQQGQLTADEEMLARIDPVNYAGGPVSDAEGRVAFPALIPGATYSVRTVRRGGRPAFQQDFTVQPGEVLNLGDIPTEKPPA